METLYYCSDEGNLEGRLFRVSFDPETPFLELLPGKKRRIQAVAVPSGEETQQQTPSQPVKTRQRIVAQVLNLEEATRYWNKYHARRHGTPTRNGMYSLAYQFGLLVVEEQDLSSSTFIPVEIIQSTNMHNLFLRIAKLTLNHKRGTYTSTEYDQHRREAQAVQTSSED